jgi:hypothetical protein
MANPENLIPATKGEVRNPKGRGLGTLNRSTIVKKWALTNQEHRNDITGEKELLTQADIITLALIKKAKEGDVNAFKEIMDSAFGKVTDKIQNQLLDENGQPTNPNDKTVTFIFNEVK